MGHRQWRGTQVGSEKPAQMTTCNAEALGERFDIALIQRATGD